MEQQFHIVGQGTQAVDRAAQLLVLVLESEEAVGVSELAEATGLPKSTASRLLTALERHGLTQRDGARGKLRAGPVLQRYAQSAAAQRNLVELATEPMEALSKASGETINLAVPAPLGVEHLAQIESPRVVAAGQWVGRHVGYHCSAVGKVFLAFDAVEPTASLERVAPRTIVDRDELDRELDRVRRRGWASAVDELEAGLAAIAAPVRGPGGDAVAALAVTGPSFRLTRSRRESLASLLVEQAHLLSRRLGYSEEGAA
jgi:IclR family transcriptional regulator, acetate operon repressor